MNYIEQTLLELTKPLVDCKKKKKKSWEDEDDYDPKGRLTSKGLNKKIDQADYSKDR